MNWYLKVVRDNYLNFKGRARRKEYWMFVLINLIISLVLGQLDKLFGFEYGQEYGGGNGIISTVYSLAILLPSLSVIARRLHDTGKSGWNFLWVFTIIGAFYVLYLLIKNGDVGINEYGPDPKGDNLATTGTQDDILNNPFGGQNNPFDKGDNPFRNNP